LSSSLPRANGTTPPLALLVPAVLKKTVLPLRFFLFAIPMRILFTLRNSRAWALLLPFCVNHKAFFVGFLCLAFRAASFPCFLVAPIRPCDLCNTLLLMCALPSWNFFFCFFTTTWPMSQTSPLLGIDVPFLFNLLVSLAPYLSPFPCSLFRFFL